MKPARKATFLSRLAQDTAGNTLAIMGAAFFPLAGLIGGGVDMTRIYITKTRLQQACDAGALSGRKAMGSGSWTVSAGGSRDQAYDLFAANFQDGDFGTSGMEREFTESDGTVTGTASADVPMTLMRIFGQETRTVSVSCTAKMEIPNTDVMFVLDVTSSMNCEPGCAYSATEQGDAKIRDLRSAVNCFYEALLKVNTTEDCSIPAGEEGGPQADPTATEYDGTAQIRFGFVPYAVNVNVGRLLPHDRLANSWQYQTRQAYTKTVHTWAPRAGVDPTAPATWSSWSGNANSAVGDDSQYTSWTVVTGADSATFSPSSGGTYRKKYNPTPSNSTACDDLNTYGSQDEIVGFQWTDGTAGTPSYTVGAAPTWVSAGNPATQAMNASRSRTETITYGYRYKWQKNGQTNNACWLEVGTKTSSNRTFSQTQTGTGSRPIDWTDYEEFDKYNYNQASLAVGGLKGADDTWNTQVSIPLLTTTTGATVYRSGSNSTSTLTVPGSADVTWDGCVEELPTWQNTDNNPADDWDPVPGTALDLKIDPPAGAQWGPLLDEAFWGRSTGNNWNTRTRNLVTTSTNLTRNLDGGGGISNGYYCPAEARRLAEYTTPTSFVSYVNGLRANAIGTYHDIGLLWGARLLSPTGLFADDNAYTTDGGAIERHLIFMTDGSAQTYNNNLYAYGSAYWDRRQTSYDPSTTQLTSLVNARTEALCTLVKNMNIKLWVISYGGGVSEDDEDRLEECADDGRYFESTDRSGLISQFKQIASEIADLRLTE